MDSVGMFVEISIALPVAAGAAAVSKEISFDDHTWMVHCYPCGAPGEAGGHLSIHLVNHTNARNAKVLFEAMVLCRADAAATAAAAGAVAPPCKNYHASSVFEYPPKGSQRFPWPRIVSATDLQQHCAVGGHATVVCGLAVLRHNPIPAPPSTYAADTTGLARRKFGDPDAAFAVGGRTFAVVRKVLAARSAVLAAELDGAKVEPINDGIDAAVPVARPRHEFGAATFWAVLLYVYCDRLPSGNECGCPVTAELVRDLLAAADWYKLDRLKLLCARKLWDCLSVETVLKTLWCADTYNCPELRSLCIDFLAVGDNFKNAATSTEDFAWLMQNSPSVFDDWRRRTLELRGKQGIAAIQD
jgi:speckle-type POZ protein